MSETIAKRCPSCGEEITFTPDWDEIVECKSCEEFFQVDLVAGIYVLSSLSLDL
jgi:transposase